MTIPTWPPLDRTSATFAADLDTLFLTTLPAVVSAFNTTATGATTDAATATTQAGVATTQAGLSATAKTAAEAARDLAAVYAAASAASTAASGAAPLWVSGATYALGACVFSPATLQTYRRKVAGAGTTDPSADAANWLLIGAISVEVVTTTSKSGSAGMHYVLTNAAASTLVLPASPSSGDVVYLTVANNRSDNLIDPGAKTITGPGGTASGALTLDSKNPSLQLRYIDNTIQWRVL